MLSDTEIEINYILRKNKSILKTHFDAGTVLISREVLTDAGFNFLHFTNQIKHQDSNHLIDFSYDFGIAESSNDSLEIIKLPV